MTWRWPKGMSRSMLPASRLPEEQKPTGVCPCGKPMYSTEVTRSFDAKAGGNLRMAGRAHWWCAADLEAGRNPVEESERRLARLRALINGGSNGKAVEI